MIDPRFPTEHDWLSFEPPHVSAGFVDRTLRRVLDERAATDADASQLDETPTPRDLLDAYRVPEPSPDFVSRAARAVADERALDAALVEHAVPAPSPDFVERMVARVRREAAASWSGVLDDHAIPGPSDDFVERTLDALREDEAVPAAATPGDGPTTPAPRERPAPVHSLPRRRWLVPAAAAAALVTALGLLVTRDDATAPANVAAIHYSPAPLGTALAATATRFATYQPADADIAWVVHHTPATAVSRGGQRR